MKWRYANKAAQLLLGDDPLKKMTFPVLIKANPVRQVFKCGDLFFKHDKRFFNGLSKEFRHALKIAAHGIPVVDHLAVSENILVTRSVENAVELKMFMTTNTPDEAMLNAFSEFIVLMKNSNFRHDDLHSGNVLYVPKENKFILVDLCNAAIVPAFFKSPAEHYSYLVMELRRTLAREKLYPLLQLCHPDDDPATVFEHLLYKCTVQTLAGWQKRKKQILSGYGKFIRKKGDILYAADAQDDLSGAEKISGNSAKYMLLHHFLELNHIPHRKVLAVSGNDIYLEPLSDPDAHGNKSLFEDFCHRLFLCGISSVPGDWQIASGTVKFIALSSAIEQSDMLEIEEK